MSLTKEQVSAFSPKERNMMIAELCGWKRDVRYSWPSHSRIPFWTSPEGLVSDVPNYCGSIDAMATALASLNPAQQLAWLSTLQQIVEPNYGLGCVLATAEQWAAAFLMVKSH